MIFTPITGFDVAPRPSGIPYLRRNRSVLAKPYRPNKYQPHQSEQEKARRVRQMRKQEAK